MPRKEPTTQPEPQGDNPLIQVDCPVCKGVAFIVCATCSGTGKEVIDSETIGKRSRDCGPCNGKGKFTCLPCQGKGWVYKS